MILEQLHRVQLLPIERREAWAFFSDPANLALITPPWLAFRVIASPAAGMHAGAIIAYQVRPLAGLPLSWVTEITHFQPPLLFVDEQRCGPYRFWHHLHRFDEHESGVEMTDLVHYRLFGGALAAPLHRLVIRPRLEAIFDFRRQVLQERFGGPG